MIVLLFVKVATGILTWVIDALPSADPPAWATSAPSAIASAVDYVEPAGNWLPVSLIVPCALAVTVAASVGLALKLGRVVLSLLTAGGGSAG